MELSAEPALIPCALYGCVLKAILRYHRIIKTRIYKEWITMKGSSSSSAVTKTLKRQSWELFIGIFVQETFCLLCGVNVISRKANSGFEACHIVARRWFYGQELTAYHLFPGCSACNNDASDICLLDYLYGRRRLTQLKRMILAIFNAYCAQYEHELHKDSKLAWLVLDRLYGPSKFPAGGGICNTKQIYEIARVEQYEQLVKRAAAIHKQQEEVCREMSLVLEAEIKPMKFE